MSGDYVHEQQRRERWQKAMLQLAPDLTPQQLDAFWVQLEAAGEELHRATQARPEPAKQRAPSETA